MFTRWGRRTILRPLVKGVHAAAVNFAQVVRSPVKLASLFGGSAGVTLAYIGALVAAVNAFNGDIPIAKVGAVYLAASALAAATPTPGGLGAIEAALVAGLTGIGMESGPAVSTVLTYRLATYWLPICPAGSPGATCNAASTCESMRILRQLVLALAGSAASPVLTRKATRGTVGRSQRKSAPSVLSMSSVRRGEHRRGS